MSDLDLEQVKDGELLKWETIGTEVVGILKSYTPRKTAMGDGNIYEVKTKEGVVPFFATMLLHKKLRDVPIGNVVKIKYIKKTKTGGGTDLKHFEVSQGKATPERLAAMGIEMFDNTASTIEDNADQAKKDFDSFDGKEEKK